MILSEDLRNVFACNRADGTALLRKRRLLARVLGRLLRSRRLQVVVVEATHLLTLRQLGCTVIWHSLLKIANVQ